MSKELTYEQRMLREANRRVEAQWGYGLTRVGQDIHTALVKAEVLNIIACLDGLDDHPAVQLAAYAAINT